MNNQTRAGDYSIANDQMVSNDATLFANFVNIDDCEVPIPNMGTYFVSSTVEPHTTSASSSSNVNYASTCRYMCTQESCRATGSKHARDESRDRKEETRKRKQPKKGLSSEKNRSSEKRRRERLREKMAALKEILPHFPSAKTDQASLLDQAIKHIRYLQSCLQLLLLALNPRQIPSIRGETGSSSAPGRLELDSFYPLPQLLMQRPTLPLPSAYLNPQQVLSLNQPGIWAPSTQERLLSQPTFADNLSATALPPSLGVGSGIIQSVPPQPNNPVPPGPSNFILVPEDVQNQASFHEDPFAAIQKYPPS